MLARYLASSLRSTKQGYPSCRGVVGGEWSRPLSLEQCESAGGTTSCRFLSRLPLQESSTPLDKANQECKDAIANGAKSRSQLSFTSFAVGQNPLTRPPIPGLGAGGTIELAEILWSPETAEAQMILTALETSISVSELDLSGARLGHDGCIRLADFLGKDRTIEVLRISSVTLPDKSLSVDASTAFGEMLKVNTRLRALRYEFLLLP